MVTEDGYDGHWDARRKAEGGKEDPTQRETPTGTWPIAGIPPTKSTTLSLLKDGDVYCWTCKECGAAMVTSTYARPEHLCVLKEEE